MPYFLFASCTCEHVAWMRVGATCATNVVWLLCGAAVRCVGVATFAEDGMSNLCVK